MPLSDLTLRTRIINLVDTRAGSYIAVGTWDRHSRVIFTIGGPNKTSLRSREAFSAWGHQHAQELGFLVEGQGAPHGNWHEHGGPMFAEHVKGIGCISATLQVGTLHIA